MSRKEYELFMEANPDLSADALQEGWEHFKEMKRQAGRAPAAPNRTRLGGLTARQLAARSAGDDEYDDDEDDEEDARAGGYADEEDDEDEDEDSRSGGSADDDDDDDEDDEDEEDDRVGGAANGRAAAQARMAAHLDQMERNAAIRRRRLAGVMEKYSSDEDDLSTGSSTGGGGKKKKKKGGAGKPMSAAAIRASVRKDVESNPAVFKFYPQTAKKPAVFWEQLLFGDEPKILRPANELHAVRLGGGGEKITYLQFNNMLEKAKQVSDAPAVNNLMRMKNSEGVMGAFVVPVDEQLLMSGIRSGGGAADSDEDDDADGDESVTGGVNPKKLAKKAKKRTSSKKKKKRTSSKKKKRTSSKKKKRTSSKKKKRTSSKKKKRTSSKKKKRTSSKKKKRTVCKKGVFKPGTNDVKQGVTVKRLCNKQTKGVTYVLRKNGKVISYRHGLTKKGMERYQAQTGKTKSAKPRKVGKRKRSTKKKGGAASDAETFQVTEQDLKARKGYYLDAKGRIHAEGQRGFVSFEDGLNAAALKEYKAFMKARDGGAAPAKPKKAKRVGGAKAKAEDEEESVTGGARSKQPRTKSGRYKKKPGTKKKSKKRAKKRSTKKSRTVTVKCGGKGGDDDEEDDMEEEDGADSDESVTGGVSPKKLATKKKRSTKKKGQKKGSQQRKSAARKRGRDEFGRFLPKK